MKQPLTLFGLHLILSETEGVFLGSSLILVSLCTVGTRKKKIAARERSTLHVFFTHPVIVLCSVPIIVGNEKVFVILIFCKVAWILYS